MAVIALAVVACVNILIILAEGGTQARRNTNSCTVTKSTPYLQLPNALGIKWKSHGGQCANAVYTVSYNVLDSSQKQYKNGKTAENYAVVENLNACTTYQIIVVHRKEKNGDQIRATTLVRDTAYQQPPLPSNVTVTFDNVTAVEIQWEKPDETVVKCLQDYLLELYSIPVDCPYLEEFRCLTKVYNHMVVNNKVTLATAGLLNECAWYAVSVTPNYNFQQFVQRQMAARFSIANGTASSLTVKNLLLAEKQPSWVTVMWKPIEMFAHCVVSYQVTIFCTVEPCVGATSEVTNSTTYNVTGLEQCSKYRIEVVSLDNFGENIGRPASINVTTSSQERIVVQSLIANSLAPHVVYLNWTLPPDKLLCVDSYSVFWNEVRDGDIIASKNVALIENWYVISELDACSKYSFHLYLHKEEKVLGLGGSVNTSTSPETPGKIQNLRAVTANHSVKLIWDRPVTSATCLNKYLVSYESINGTRQFLRQSLFERNSNRVIVPSTNTTAELNDLPACVAYSISVYTIGMDNSESKPETLVVTVMSEVLPEPSSGKVLHVTQTSARLQWNIPYTTLNLCPMIKMKVQCGNSEAYFKKRDALGNVEGIINGLMPYTKYKCIASAYSSAGISVSTENTDVLTIQGIPSEPTNVTISMGTSSRILVMWSQPTQIPGVLTAYTVHVRRQYLTYFVPSSCTPKVFEDYTISVPANKTSVWLNGLQPAMSMTVSINAATVEGNGPMSAELIATTLSGESEHIRNVSVSVSQNRTKVTWKHPCYTNGVLFHFLVELSGIRVGHPNVTRMSWSSKACTLCKEDPVYEEILYELEPEYAYLTQVSPIGFLAGSRTDTTFQTPASIPPEPSLPVMSSLEPVPTYTQADLILYSNLFSESNGHILYYAILLSEDEFPVEPQSGWIDSTVSWPFVDTWSMAYKSSPISMYQATPIRWNPFNASSPYKTVEVTYTLGKDDCSSVDPIVYCNGPLNPGTMYALRIRAFTSAGYRDSQTIKFKTEAFASLITLIIVSLVVTVIATISIFMYLLSTGRITRMTREVTEKKQNVEVTLEYQLLAPVPVKKFLIHCNTILNSSEKLKEEFQLLTTMSADIKMTSDIALLPQNRKKNRYINVLPYDTNRVILEGEPEEGYINASYIRFPGEKPNIEYIACQAPKEEYTRDFWQMMIQCNVSIIVMLCLKMEKGKVKCFIYYPQLSEAMEFNDITVVCTEKRMYQFHTVRTLVVTKDNRQYTILHYHFVDWPDFGVPSSSDVMLHFCQAVRAESKCKDCVMAVHCSAGVGRTGTYIALDNLIRHIRNDKKMNVLATVLTLREQRANMVQTEIQYGYIYKCLKHALEHQADFLRGDAKAAERLARQDLFPLTRRDSNFTEIDSVT